MPPPPELPPRPPLLRRLRRRAARAVPLFVWVGTAAAVLWLYERQHHGLRAAAYAVESVYTVAPESAGRLTTVAVGVHAPVEFGQLVASLDPAVLELRLRGAQVELARLRAELNREELLQRQSSRERAGQRIADLRRFAAEREQAHVAYLETVAQQEEDRIRLHGLALELARQNDLLRQGVASESRLDEVRTDHDALQERIAKIEEVLKDLRARYAQSSTRYEEFVREVPAGVGDGETDSLVAPLRHAAEAQQVVLEEVSLLRARLALRAPATGTVDQILIRAGEVVAAGQPVLTIIEPNPREIVAYLDEATHVRVKQGMKAMLERQADRSRVATVVLRKGTRMLPIPVRATRDPSLPHYGMPVFLRCPTDAGVVPGEAFTVQLLEGKGPP